MLGNVRIRLLNVETIQNDETGEREKTITSLTTVLGEKSIVGMQTFWSATSANVNLSCVFIVRKQMYKNQKYAYANGELYEIHSTSKSSNLNNIQLNAIIVKNTELKESIKNALGII